MTFGEMMYFLDKRRKIAKARGPVVSRSGNTVVLDVNGRLTPYHVDMLAPLCDVQTLKFDIAGE